MYKMVEALQVLAADPLSPDAAQSKTMRASESTEHSRSSTESEIETNRGRERNPALHEIPVQKRPKGMSSGALLEREG